MTNDSNSRPFVVTRHKALVEYLREVGAVSGSVDVLAHATADDLRGRDVFGVLPLHLAAACRTVTEVPLDIPATMRGVELTLEEVRQYAKPMRTFVVREQVDQANAVKALVDAVRAEMGDCYEGAFRPPTAAEIEAHRSAVTAAVVAAGGTK
jgi:hypothetical protein